MDTLSLQLKHKSVLFEKIKIKNQVWMSHGDHVEKKPDEFFITSLSNNKIISSIEHKNKKIFGLQFHPEVYHSLEGKKILSNFLLKFAK